VTVQFVQFFFTYLQFAESFMGISKQVNVLLHVGVEDG